MAEQTLAPPRAPGQDRSAPGHRRVLDDAVAGIGGADRPGQHAMADAVAQAFDDGRHVLVQAGTGTGKSLGYLAPALVWLSEHPGERVVVATATLALQSQLAHSDIPAALDAVERVTGRRPEFSVLKGRSNYACLLRVRDGGVSEQGTLISAGDLAATARTSATPESALGTEVLALREWAEEEASSGGVADRDDAPSHGDRAWQQVSVPVRECLGAQRCPYGDVCLVEKSRDRARAAGLVVTNHALLAIDAMHGGTALPEHHAVVVDEAHELVARVTGAASAELSPQQVERVARRALTFLSDETALDLLESADELRTALDEMPLERVEDPGSPFVVAAQRVRAAARAAVSGLTSGTEKPSPEQRQAAAAVGEVLDVAERMAGLSAYDVVWVTERERSGREARVAPLSVAGLMRSSVFADRTVVLTSATLKLGDDFGPSAAALGLRARDRDDSPEPYEPAGDEDAPDDPPVAWRALDVGSPFDYQRQGIRYVARTLPAPGRDGMSKEVLDEIAELVWAAGGRTLGLFSSRRAAEAAAVHVRKQLPRLTVLCQGDAQLSELTRRFTSEETTSLFGTLSLWQGVDVPGATCQLVIIDRIPFPRPDDPLTLARQKAVADAGGNGFMSVAATHAALLLAQGSGRLVRRSSDRGVVAVLDPRLVTARYGSFLRASMPDMWQTTDRETVIGALRRLAEEPSGQN
ncbi:ATP-dependent DNA helicase DinG [Microlunatus flavus]|uniref:ATP-dependent helicase DinG n=2 Tax=Microlunatus flavus TaxID=1036181 RepID=A0A1H9JBN7_9ACTN|nr:ATP-dependent DNA helicase DinG [Microlunatus flavus]